MYFIRITYLPIVKHLVIKREKILNEGTTTLRRKTKEGDKRDNSL